MKRPWKDFAAFMDVVYGVMVYIDDPDEDADENVVYCPRMWGGSVRGGLPND